MWEDKYDDNTVHLDTNVDKKPKEWQQVVDTQQFVGVKHPASCNVNIRTGDQLSWTQMKVGISVSTIVSDLQIFCILYVVHVGLKTKLQH